MDEEPTIQDEWKRIEKLFVEATDFTRHAVEREIDKFAIWLRGKIRRKAETMAPPPTPVKAAPPPPPPLPTRPTTTRPTTRPEDA